MVFNIRKSLKNAVTATFIEKIRSNFPTQIIGKSDIALPYLERTIILESTWGSITLHRFQRNDLDVPHDHSFDFITLILRGQYREECFIPNEKNQLIQHNQKIMKAGMIGFRRAETIHRVHVDEGEAYTLVFRGPKFREWSFWTDKGSIVWYKFLNSDEPQHRQAQWLISLRYFLIKILHQN